MIYRHRINQRDTISNIDQKLLYFEQQDLFGLYLNLKEFVLRLDYLERDSQLLVGKSSDQQF